METVYMKFDNKKGDTCLVIAGEDDMYVLNKDKLTVSYYSVMDSFFDIIELIDVKEDILMPEEQIDCLKEWITNNLDVLDKETIVNLLINIKPIS